MPRDLYQESVTFGLEYVGITPSAEMVGRQAGYWIARHAARETAGALLQEAKRIGVTPEQWEALRAVAVELAYD